MRPDINIHLYDEDQIRCEHYINERQPEGYPVLILDGARGHLTIFPTMDRLERLHAAIGAYLAVHRRPVPAEACTGAAVDVDELITSIFE